MQPSKESTTTTSPLIKTRFLILSDTHAEEFRPDDEPIQHADVAIHCGDLTNGSSLEEFCSAIRLLKKLKPPLKIVIAGNHDFTLDIPAYEKKIQDAQPPLDPSDVLRTYGAHGEARRLFDEAREAGSDVP